MSNTESKDPAAIKKAFLSDPKSADGLKQSSGGKEVSNGKTGQLSPSPTPSNGNSGGSGPSRGKEPGRDR